MNKPSWNDAPEWARWLARDDDGDWYWYESKPNWDRGMYVAEGKIELAADSLPLEGYLEERPE